MCFTYFQASLFIDDCDFILHICRWYSVDRETSINKCTTKSTSITRNGIAVASISRFSSYKNEQSQQINADILLQEHEQNVQREGERTSETRSLLKHNQINSGQWLVFLYFHFQLSMVRNKYIIYP